MNVITAPNLWEGVIHRDPDMEPSIFLAGGITGCPDWQSQAVQFFDTTRCTLLNPRRPDFPMDDPNAAEQQIRWERLHLNHADATIFWFPKDTLCPIVLFELGTALYSRDSSYPLFIGCEPSYQRLVDVQIQTKIIRPTQKIHDSLEGVFKEAQVWAYSYKGTND